MGVRIEGAFPGGPRRGEAARAHPFTKPALAEELAERAVLRRAARARARRLRRITLVYLCAAILAAVVGFSLGLASRRTPADLVEEQEAARRSDGDLLSQEVNRTLLELWKMEDFESLRDRGRIR
jgi:hypothetical protein